MRTDIQNKMVDKDAERRIKRNPSDPNPFATYAYEVGPLTSHPVELKLKDKAQKRG